MSWSGIVDAELHSSREILVFLSALLLGGIALTYQRILGRDNRRLEEELPDAQSRPKHGPVLIVDHRPTIRAMLKSALERRGFSVLLAEDGQRAVKIFRREDVSAVLLELTVPGMADGPVLEEMQRAKPNVSVLRMQGAGQNARQVGGDEGEDVLTHGVP